jgi:hypothetical protein
MPSSRVTDEQVHRLGLALYGEGWDAEYERVRDVRRALEAALAKPEGEADEELEAMAIAMAAGEAGEEFSYRTRWVVPPPLRRKWRSLAAIARRVLVARVTCPECRAFLDRAALAGRGEGVRNEPG